VVAILEKAIQVTAESAEFRKAGESLGVRPAYLPADEFSALIAAEDAALSRLMTQIGLKK
jgi:tripartite-type tricarboxylate transporter receptor subunit TctC